jgi:hypothetical protein
MELTALPRDVGKDGFAGSLHSGVVITNDKLYPVQAALSE